MASRVSNSKPGIFIFEAREGKRIVRKVYIVLPLALLFLAYNGVSFAQDSVVEEVAEVVVTATRIRTTITETAASVTVITSEEIQRKNVNTVYELLRTVPGLGVVQNGGVGQPSSVFIRGSKSEDALVLIDGIEVNDPITPGRSFNFAHLSVDNIERIEILRGPAGTLYGSDAMAGVIKIVTKRGEGKPRASISVETGSFRSLRTRFGLIGGNENGYYSLAVSRFDSDGISAASENRGNSEEDAYKNTSLSATAGLSLSEGLEVDLVLRLQDARVEQDDFDFATGLPSDDLDYFSKSEQVFFRVEGQLISDGGGWEQALGFSVARHDRLDRNDPDDAFDFNVWNDTFAGDLLKVDWVNTFYLSIKNTFLFGLETEEENGRTSTLAEKTARTTAAFILEQVDINDRLHVSLGLRTDDHSSFGDETTYSLAPVYTLADSGTKFRAAYGTGFKAPTLFQLFSSYGDPTLDPERSRGWEAGFDQEIAGGAVDLGVTYFFNDFDNLIDFDSAASTYKNLGAVRTEGVEFMTSFRPADNLKLAFNYTLTKTEDDAGQPLVRRPDNKAAFELSRNFDSSGNVDLEVVYIGERDDFDFSTFPASRVELAPYTLVNASATVELGEKITLTGRIENLFDEDYEEVLGYGTAGISGYVGLKAEL